VDQGNWLGTSSLSDPVDVQPYGWNTGTLPAAGGTSR
jgi:hypothetical protein